MGNLLSCSAYIRVRFNSMVVTAPSGGNTNFHILLNHFLEQFIVLGPGGGSVIKINHRTSYLNTITSRPWDWANLPISVHPDEFRWETALQVPAKTSLSQLSDPCSLENDRDKSRNPA